jgi:CRP-like cAMP-binding protein|tara:strand:+ start:137 stop:463 length:327 start_codon:yes stop_codon:yes gene_type:complete
MVPVLHKPDDNIILEGEKGKYFYFIAIGKLSVTHQFFPVSPEEKPTQLLAGDYFGELSLIFNCRRTCTVKSLNYSTLAMIDQDSFVKSSRKFIMAIRNQTINYNDKYK